MGELLHPRCRLDKVEEYGVNDAEKLCKYFSKVYQQRSCSLTTWSPVFEIQLLPLDQHYLQNLRYPTGGTPRFLKADTPADVQRSKEVRKRMLSLKLLKMLQIRSTEEEDQGKGDAQASSKNTKPPPACATEPPPKATTKRLRVICKHRYYGESEGRAEIIPPDTTVKKHKAAPATDTTVKKESSNKISLTPRGTSSTPATSSATPIPPAGPPPEKVPKPPSVSTPNRLA